MTFALAGLAAVLVAMASIAPTKVFASSWSIPKTPNPTEALTTTTAGISCPTPTECISVGYYLQAGTGATVLFAERWNGKEWTLQSPPIPTGASSSFFSGVSCSAKSACTAVGAYLTSAGRLTLAERWNGTKWSLQSTPNPTEASLNALAAVSCPSSTSCTAVGYTNSGTLTPLAESWNGTEWSIRKLPTSEVAEELLGVSCSASNACIAVGQRFVGSATLSSADRWNGTEWIGEKISEPGGASSSNLASVSCPSVSACSAVGQFTNSTSETFSWAAHWNGSEWLAQAVPKPSGAKTSTLKGVSCNLPTECTAGGYYEENTTGKTVNLVERFRGTEWTAQPAPNPENAKLSQIAGVSCFTSSECTFGGTTIDSKGRQVTLVVKYAAWTLEMISNPLDGLEMQAISCFSTAGCMAAGAAYSVECACHVLYPEVYGWSGSSWSSTGPLPPQVGETHYDGYLSGVACASTSSCMGVGRYLPGGPTRAEGDLWNGKSWSNQAPPTLETRNWLNDVSCPSTSLCFAVGANNPGGIYVPMADRWNGVSWTMQTVPKPTGTKISELSSIHCISTTSCIAVGWFSTASPAVPSTLVESWNGTEWTVQESPNPSGAKSAELEGVACTSSASCTAVGTEVTSAGVEQTLAEEFNGTEWTVIQTPHPNGSTSNRLEDIACMSTNWCLAAGRATVGGVNEPLVQGWNGSEWGLQSVPSKSASLFGITCLSSVSCKAIGNTPYGGSLSRTEGIVESYLE